jgi:excisionase family DNA binding protein
VALLNVEEAAERLGLKPRTVRKWILTRKITFIHVGRSVRISSRVVAGIIKQNTVRARKSSKRKSAAEDTP